MTLTVRLDPALESALDRHCADRGVSKSLVVQESLAAYLLEQAPTTAPAGKSKPRTFSASFRAFADAGLLASVASGGGADKAAVRKRVAERLKRD